MAFSLSPAVTWSEIDDTTNAPVVGTTGGCYAGTFRWGPVGVRTLIDSEKTLVKTFGEPDNDTFLDFFTCANFLAYGDNLNVVRVVAATGAKNSTSDGTGLLIQNEDVYNTQYANGTANKGVWAGKYPGELGNGLIVSMADAGNFGSWAYNKLFSAAPGTSTYAASKGGSNDELHVVVIDGSGEWTGTAGSVLETYPFLSKAADATAEDGTSAFYATVLSRKSQYVWWIDHPTQGTNWGNTAAGTNFVTLSATIVFTAVTGSGFTVGENVYSGASFSAATKVGKVVSYTSGTKTLVINVSKGTFASGDTIVGQTSATSGAATTVTNVSLTDTLAGGASSNESVQDGEIITGYDLFQNGEDVDVSLVLNGAHSTVVGLHLINDIAEARKDCVAFVSPQMSDVVNNAGNEAAAIVATRNMYPSSSYYFMDGNWKYQYDKYNDVFRWVPCNGDVAGLAVQTDETRDPWWSFAGLNRGNIKNVVKLAWNPSKPNRDVLFNANVNPIVSFPGQGAVLFGDKTGLAKPSAFNFVNIRRLFIAMEKSIATAAKFLLFEQNDDFTRAAFISLVDPYLRDIQGRRGIVAYEIVCNKTNNTPDVINNGNFVGDIYVQATPSVRAIQLNFINTPVGSQFSEFVGSV